MSVRSTYRAESTDLSPAGSGIAVEIPLLFDRYLSEVLAGEDRRLAEGEDVLLAAADRVQQSQPHWMGWSTFIGQHPPSPSANEDVEHW